MMPSFEYDIGYLENALPLLEDYLLSKDIYWKLNVSSPAGEPGYPALTLGTLMLVEARLQARQMTANQNQKYSHLMIEYVRIRSKWKSTWGKKAKLEFRPRLNLWGNFLEEFRKDPMGNFDRYGYEVGRRVMLEFLAAGPTEISAAQQELLKSLDRILEGLMVPGEFVWDGELAPGFPPERFPYLYRTMKE